MDYSLDIARSTVDLYIIAVRKGEMTIEDAISKAVASTVDYFRRDIEYAVREDYGELQDYDKLRDVTKELREQYSTVKV